MLKLEKPIKLDAKMHLAPNLTDRFEETDLRRIGLHVRQGFDADKLSRESWESRMRAGMDLALQVVKEKSFPWPNASNVAFPLVTVGALQFHSRAYPQLVSGKEVVKIKEWPGASDIQKTQAAGAAAYMNLQLLETSSWEEESDRGLLHLAIAGCLFKKTYFSSVSDQVESELVTADALVLDYFAKSVETCRRKSHCYPLHKNVLIEGMRSDPPKYRPAEDASWFQQPVQPEPTEGQAREGSVPPDQSDPVTPFSCIEQHCWLDLDADGYEEPYIVTLDLGSNEVLRLVARWERAEDIIRNARGKISRIVSAEHFTKYGFIPAPDNSVYDIGFGSLLGPLNESVSTLINQLVDAGTLKTTGGGFLGKGAKIRGGTLSFAPGEWKRVESIGDDLRKNLVPLDPPEPSPVLFQLLGLLIQYTNRISGAIESLSGENPGQNTPKSNMDSMVEQGMKIYAAIFKRVWRAMKEEFRKIYIFNAFYAPVDKQRLFKGDPRLCTPVADPEVSSESDRRTRAMLIAERAASVRGYSARAVELNFLRAMHVENPEQFFTGEGLNAPPPEDPRITVEKMRQFGRQESDQLGWRRFLVELQAGQREQEATIFKLLAEAKRAMAQAEGERDNSAIVAMQTALGAMKLKNEDFRGRLENMIRLAEMESEPEKRRVDTEPIRRLADPATNSSLAGPGPAEAGAPEGPLGLGPDPGQ